MGLPASRPAYVGRILPPEEWKRLPADLVAPLDPEYSYIAVVEYDGAIVARWMALNTVHVDGCYISPHHRGPTVTRELVVAMFGALEAAGVQSILTLIADPKVMELARHLGFQPVLVDNGSGEQVAPTLFRLDRVTPQET